MVIVFEMLSLLSAQPKNKMVLTETSHASIVRIGGICSTASVKGDQSSLSQCGTIC